MDVDADIDYKELYKKMKRKLKILIYENECFQEELRKSQRVLLQVQRDKSFLLDRILQYQQGPDTTSDSEETEESEAEVENNKDNKRKKTSSDSTSFASLPPQSGSRGSTAKKKKNTLTGNSSRTANNHKQNSKIKASQSTVARQSQKGKDSWVSQYHKKTVQKRSNKLTPSNSLQNLSLQKSLDHQTLHPQSVDHKTVHPHSSSSRWTVLSNQTQLPMTREEVERQLAARQPFSDFATTVSLTLPNQLFSDNLLEADLLEDFDTSPSNVEDESLIDSFD